MQVRIVGWLELLAKARSESTIIDSATDLKQQIGAASGPSHLLTFVHPAVDQKIGRAFGDRGTNSQSGPMPLGVIDQPVALSGQIFIECVQGSPQGTVKLSGVLVGAGGVVRYLRQMTTSRAASPHVV